MGNELVILYSDDWSGLYVDGSLYYEGHDIPDYVWVNLVKKNLYYVSVKTHWVNEEYMHETGNFPYKLNQLPKEVLS